MKHFAVAAALLLASSAPSAEQAPAAVRDSCAAKHDRIIGPKTGDRPLPLMSGDELHGFRPACNVRWAALSPRGEPVTVTACYRENLLQIDNETACGVGKGRLWVSIRWVVTRAATEAGSGRVACQHLDTAAYAGTRGLPPPCVAR